MKKLRDNGKSYSEIATILNKENIPTRYTKDNKKCSWYSTTVRNTLNRQKVGIKDKKKRSEYYKMISQIFKLQLP